MTAACKNGFNSATVPQNQIQQLSLIDTNFGSIVRRKKAEYNREWLIASNEFIKLITETSLNALKTFVIREPK